MTTSERQSAPNRRNSHASTGPRTAKAKTCAASNSPRDGLSLPLGVDPALTKEVEQLAREAVAFADTVQDEGVAPDEVADFDEEADDAAEAAE